GAHPQLAVHGDGPPLRPAEGSRLPQPQRVQRQVYRAAAEPQEGPPLHALYRAGNRRVGRPHDDGRQGSRAAHCAPRAAGPRHRHPPHRGYPAPE
nr:hypothetical protein [Tanacetum cinerariifolium]